MAKDIREDLSNIVIMIVNADDEKSVCRMVNNCQVKQTITLPAIYIRSSCRVQILINCVGPQQKYGERIISHCIRAGTHYVDVCNDPHFNELMHLKYQEKAEANNVYVVPGCGFQSFPFDIGINYIRDIFNGKYKKCSLSPLSVAPS